MLHLKALDNAPAHHVSMEECETVRSNQHREVLMNRTAWRIIGFLAVCLPVGLGYAEEKRRVGDQVLEGVLSGVLGTPPSTVNYTTQERDRLVSLLQSGEYVTSRQGEPIDTVAYGVPLTGTAHVYTARPIPPSRVNGQ